MRSKGLGSYTTGGGGFQPVFIKLQPAETHQGSEGTALDEPTWKEEVSFNLITPDQLKNEIGVYSAQHTRPISDKEYAQFLEMLKSGKDNYGNPLYGYQKSAIARVLKENTLKYFPSLTLDPVIETALKDTTELNNALRSLYHEALEKFRDTFVTTKATDMENLYSPEEINRLRGMAIAFVGENYKSYETPEVMVATRQITAARSYVKEGFQHPMLRYNLINKK